MENNTKQTLKIFWQHTRGYKFTVILGLLATVAASGINTMLPLFFKKFFDILASGQSQTAVIRALLNTLIIIVIIELSQWIMHRIKDLATAHYQAKVMADLSNTCFGYLHQHSFSFFNNNFVGSLVKRVNRFYNSYVGISDRITYNLAPLFVTVVLITIILLRKNIYLGLLVIIWTILFLIINYFLTKYKLKYDIQRSEAETNISRILADTITNHNNVKLFNGYNKEVKYFAQANEGMRKLRKLTWNLDIMFDGIQGLMMIGLEIGIFYYAIRLWGLGLVTIGDFVLIQSYLIYIFMRIWEFGRVIRHVYENLADAEEMTEIFLTPHEIVDNKTAKELTVKKGKIEFHQVTFCYYQTRCVVQNLNLAIEPKEKIALVGPSGAGKTTLIKLLLRMHDVTGGEILIDGQSIREVTQESLWQNISMVPQDPILFHRTLMENIRYGKTEASNQEVTNAAKLAHCHEFISEFPDSYETKVGERGIKLSGGERQRVAIARAILRNAPILVLDEATSSLDSESEHLIQAALDNLMKDKTVIVIAHRLSTIMKVDRIVVVTEGGIIEEGTHQALLEKKDGIYKKLWQIQAGGFIE